MTKKILDENKILLVISSKDMAEMQQQIDFFKTANLFIPESCTLEVHPIVGSKNLAASFNEVQKKYDAKYKIYLNANVSYVSESLITDAYDSFFLAPKTGMIGLLGSEMPPDGDYINAKNFYGDYSYLDEQGEVQNYFGKDPLYIQSVRMLEFSFFATNVDIEWDEKIGENFILAAQCCKMREAGLEVGVIWQEKTWLTFSRDECSYNFDNRQKNYSKQLEKFRFLYKDFVTPLVSVLIPTYNQPRFCMEALESALSQTYPNIEILVGDDSTNEETKSAIQTYLKKYKNIKYFFHGKPLGGKGGSNMKFLLNHCSGDFVNFLLHDDLFYPEKISKMMNYYLQDLDGKISLVTCARDLVDKNTDYVQRHNPWQPKTDMILDGRAVGRMFLLIIANFLGELTTVLFKKKDLFMKNTRGQKLFSIGVFEGVIDKAYGDMSTWLNILSKGGDCVFIAEPLAAFRWHPAQNTNDKGIRIALPLEAVNFMTIAFLSNLFFNNFAEYKFCMKKWPIFLDRWFTDIKDTDTDEIKKLKTWAIKLREVIETDDDKKILDCAISYLLSRLPKDAKNVSDVKCNSVLRFIRKNETTGLWDKANDRVMTRVM